MTRTRAVAFPLILAAALFALFFWLGYDVSRYGEPSAFSGFAQIVRGRGVGIAWAFTNAGYGYVIAPLCAISVLVAIFSPQWRLPALFVVAVTLVCWGAADGFQHFFARPRRHDWLIARELAYSYPSSHATIATGFYFLWGLLIFGMHVPNWVRYAALVAGSALDVGIMWSRLALAAHYPTDVAGGFMLGLIVILVGSAFVHGFGGRLARR